MLSSKTADNGGLIVLIVQSDIYSSYSTLIVLLLKYYTYYKKIPHSLSIYIMSIGRYKYNLKAMHIFPWRWLLVGDVANLLL